MSAKWSPRPRKRKQKEDMKEQIVAQVHKSVKSTTSSENDNVNSEESSEINKTYKIENGDQNHTPSREISVDNDSQINSKILSLIETEIKRDAKKHSHFTDSRPQSLSFYEDEKVPEEVSGNLELLSPEERKHYKKRKEYLQTDTDERNAYNVIQDIFNPRDAEDIISSSLKKSKSRKKRHNDSELGMGDSREMMIPKEKKKSKKKRRDSSPSISNNIKRKHKKRDDDNELRNDITAALEELQDDVFENHEEFTNKPERMKKSPRKSDKLYVQKKTKFEVTPRNTTLLNRQGAQEPEDGRFSKRMSTYPLEIAICYQRWWMSFSTLCHGLLGGLALGHWLYIVCNFNQQDETFLVHYAFYSDIYVGLFFALCVVCIVSVFDRLDIAHFNFDNRLSELWKRKKSSIVVIIYVSCLIVHLSSATYDDKLSIIRHDNNTFQSNITISELNTWNHLSLWRAILAFTAWLIVGLGPPEDTLYHHLKYMEAYLPDK